MKSFKYTQINLKKVINHIFSRLNTQHAQTLFSEHFYSHFQPFPGLWGAAVEDSFIFIHHSSVNLPWTGPSCSSVSEFNIGARGEWFVCKKLIKCSYLFERDNKHIIISWCATIVAILQNMVWRGFNNENVSMAAGSNHWGRSWKYLWSRSSIRFHNTRSVIHDKD